MLLQSINAVVASRLCVGCGACAYICPAQKITLVDFAREGIRPVADDASCGDCRDCLEVCPAVHSDFSLPDGFHRNDPSDATFRDPQFVAEWGPVLEIWEGHAADPDLRYIGSSGGALTALAAYCIERAGMHGVLQVAQDPNDAVRNRTQLTRSRQSLLKTTGSRYSPASVCNGLNLVESAPGPCAVIGQPSEIAAVQNAQKLRPELKRNIGLTLSFFCAGSPATSGTIDLLKKLGVTPDELEDLRYRGRGWPGNFAPTRRGASRAEKELSYSESWAFLQAHRPWSVHQWPDGAGELADISCGDPWYEKPDGNNPGFSLVVVRTERGRSILQGAITDGYLRLTRAQRWKLENSQTGLLKKKGSVWGRRLASRLMGLPTTRFRGLDLYRCWRKLSVNEKLRSTAGTMRRIIARNLRRRLVIDPNSGTPIKPPVAEPN